MKKLKQAWNSFKNARYAKLITFFFILFLFSGTFLFLVETNKNGQFERLFDGWWWAIITFSTTGYGDKVPITGLGKMIAVVSIFIGIAAMSVLSGTFASIFVERNTKARRGLMDFRKKSGHFIICGWKDHMEDILVDILNMTPDLSSEDIVIISNIESERIESLKEQKILQGINYVRGDYFSEAALRRANVRQSRKVLVLSDTYESSAVSEVDSKTVMTVLTIKAISKDIYTCAELLDRKYESYLKQIMCDEILFSRDFSRRIIASTSAINGMSHIVQSLLAHDNNSGILTTDTVPAEHIGKTYGEFRTIMAVNSGRVLLGILENTGSPNRIKIEALREAQKTSDISQLISNLQHVKDMEVNKPVLIPNDDYVIQRYSKAIILERKQANG